MRERHATDRTECLGLMNLLVGSIFACIGWIPAHRVRTLLVIGVSWVLLAIAYEFTLGYLVFHHPLGEIASDFDLFHGRLLPIGLLVLLFAPLLAARGLRASPAFSASHV